MAYQFIRGDTASNDSLTRDAGALSLDLEGQNIRVHDGTTPGGAFQVGLGGGGGDTEVSLSTTYATGTVTITNSAGSNATINSASTSQAGVMSSADKEKLDGVEAGAQANVGDTFDEGGNYTGLRAQATTRDDVGLGTAAFKTEVESVIEANEWSVDEGVLT